MKKIETRKDLETVLESIVSKPLEYLLNGDCYNAGIESIHEKSIPEFELFSRLCYGLAPLCTFKEEADWINYYNSRIISGTNKNSDGYFGDLYNYDQKNVELVPLLMMMWLNPKSTWETYSDQEKQNVVNWFSSVNNVNLVQNNWQFFGLLVNLVLSKLSQDYTPEISKYWEKIDSYYLGDGWYGDGPIKRIDYYNAFGFHFYSLLAIKIDPELPHRDIIIERAFEFSKYYIHFFNNDGSTIPFGRSLIYRFAQSSFWSMLAVNGIYPLPPATMRKVIYDNLSWWTEQGIYDGAGLLSVGYTYPNQYISEDYNSWGSPYWCLKVFYVLLAQDDFFEAADDEAYILPDNECNCASGKFSIRHFNNCSTLYPGYVPKSYVTQYESKYNRFAYNSWHGFNLSKSMSNLTDSGLESTLAFSNDGAHFVTKEFDISTEYNGSYISHCWEANAVGSVTSVIIPLKGADHIRVHFVDSKVSTCAFDFGYAFPVEKRGPISINLDKPNGKASFKIGKRECSISSPLRASSFRTYRCGNNLNIFKAHTAVPFCQTDIVKGKNVLINVFSEDVDVERYEISVDRNTLHYKLNNEWHHFNLKYSQKGVFYKRVKLKIKRRIKKSLHL